MNKCIWAIAVIVILSQCSSPTNKDESQLPKTTGFHFSPNHGTINKPISLFLDGETYHLIYSTGSDQWGHASSDDLIRWNTVSSIELPIETLGDVVVDQFNTSGLTSNGAAWIAFYEDAGNIKAQYSLDQNTWKELPLSIPDVNGIPKISWYEPTEKWIMTLANDLRLLILSSSDLTNWTKEGEIAIVEEAESAQLIPIENDWILFKKGQEYQYQIGSFDGSSFMATSDWNTIQMGSESSSFIVAEMNRKSFLNWLY